MSEAIEKTKNLIEPQIEEKRIKMEGIAFDTFQKVYAETNENINGCFQKLNWENKKSVLTVLGSGDHAFDAILFGASSVDTFDCNALTEYYALGLKRAAILTLSYYEYLLFLRSLVDPSVDKEELFSTIQSCYPNMEAKYKEYWEEVLTWFMEKEESKDCNFFRFFLMNIEHLGETTLKNRYLSNKEDYELLKKRLSEVDISFTCCDYKDLPSVTSQKYDLLVLSNILDYEYKKSGQNWNYEKLKEIENHLSPLMNENGEIVLGYLYNYCNEKGIPYRRKLILQSDIEKKDLIEEQVFTFPKIKDNQEMKLQDALISMTVKK